MESDDRFKHLALDPRFKTLRKKERKVQIDDRFKSMFTDKKFTLKYSKDKRGQNQKKTSGDDLRKYYSLENQDEVRIDAKKRSKTSQKQRHAIVDKEPDSDSESEEDENKEEDDELDSDEEETTKESGESEEEVEEEEEEEEESELSSSSDESESEEEASAGEENELDVDKIQYDWQPLDHDAETGDSTSKRLAIQNLDWDHLDVKDVYTLVHSIRPPVSVKIFVSEFGKERLKEEELRGPKEIVDMPRDEDEEEEEYNMLKQKMEALNSKEPKSYKINEYEDADEELNPKNEEIRERIRRYQLSRMKYYYAVVEFDSVESAEVVYKELDGMEYEGSSLELDLRFIPDDIEFDTEDMKAECNHVPDLSSYTAPQFINSALQQTTVKFTWDETDIKRQGKLQRAYTKNELEKDDLEAYLGSETDSESEDDEGEDFNDAVSVVTANSEARINKYKMLLASLEEEAEKKKKVDVDVEWGNYSEDEEKLQSMQQNAKEIDEEGEEEDEEDGYTSEEFDDAVEEVDGSNDSDIAPESEQPDRREKKRGRGKSKRRKDKESSEEKEDEAELDLLVMDVNGKKADEFKFNPDDDRFKAVYESGVYNIDPSHPNFKRTQAFDVIAEKKRSKRQRTRT